MPQIINTNIASLNAQRNLNNSQRLSDSALQRLSSGLRINSAKDDAAGLAISTRFDAQVRGTSVAIRNAGDGISLAQTAESALNSMVTNLQRIRELALQSANDTNTGLDRAALQQEASQLVDEIKNIAEKTNFNGKKLLDGSFQNAVFQTGANVGDTISVSVAKLDTQTLGSAESAGLSSSVSVTGTTTGNPMSGGDLVINGVSVGASSGADDDASVALASSSAIAKAAAINKVSDQSGVTAVVNENYVRGSGAAYTSGTSGKVTINGVQFTLQNASTLTAEQNMRNTADIINEKSELTGVRAEFISTTQGVALIADDGRNISIKTTNSNVDSADFGLAAVNTAGSGYTTYVGTFTLVSDDGSDIVITSDTGNIDNAGLEEGTFSGINGGSISDADEIASGKRAALAVGDLVINGVAVGATNTDDDKASFANADASAIAVAAAINKVADQTGVSAKANTNVIYSGDIGTATAATKLTINNVDINISFNAGDDIAVKQQAVIDAINGKSGQTGVRAEALDSDSFKLVAEDGRNITVVGTAANTTYGLTTTAAAKTFAAGVTLESAGQFTLSSQTGNISRSGFREGTFGGGEFGQKLSDIDISTVDGANKAVQAVDNALKTITSKQAELGAIQNRFQNTISNLEALSENLQAANSRIRDADFAAETAKLSKAQVLQQAGISVLAQANARPQQVLSLLQ